MKQFSNVATTVAAAACLVSVADARRSPFFARNNARSWQPAVQTAAANAIAAGKGPGDLQSMPQIAMNDFIDGVPAAEPPATTAAPVLNPRFLKRDSTDNTCAYVSGISSVSLYCDTTDECVANSINSMVGCCPDTSTTCPIPTTCYPSSEGSLYTTSNGYTLWCGSSEYPECVTHYYADNVFTGYTLLGCGKTEAVDKVWYQPTSDSTSSSSSSTSSKSSAKKSTSTASSATAPGTTTTSSTSTASATGGGGDNNNGGATAKKSNTGAIAGGVVGGVAGLALIALGAFFLIRRNNKNKVNNAGGVSGAGAPGPNGGQPPMGQTQQPYYGGPGGGDPNAAGYAAAGAAAGGVAGLGAAAAYNHQQQQHDPNLYNPNQQYGGYPPQQSPPIQQDAKVYDPYNPNGQQYDPNAVAASASGSPPLVQSPQSGVYNAAAVAPGGHISPHETISPYSAPPPQPGMGFHSGPVPTTLDVAELSTERNDGELRELA